MKTQILNLLNQTPGWLFILVLIIAISPSCDKDNELKVYGDPDFEIFTVGPEGGTISAFFNSVYLVIPEGAFINQTTVEITRKPVYIKLDSLILMKNSFTIYTDGHQSGKPFTLQLEYCQKELSINGKEIEKCLNIYGFKNHCNGMIELSNCIPQIGKCRVNCKLEVIEASFSNFGTFIAGKKVN